MAGNTYGRQVVEALVNKSGGAVAAGDVVIIDTSNDGAFTTTTTGRSEVTIGVVQETIASNATGRVLLSGFAALVNVPASVTRGHFVETHTVAKQATGNSTRRSGSFGQFRTGGTTPTAVLWGQPDVTASGGGGGSLTGSTALLSGDVSMPTGNTYYDGPSIVLSAGTWLLSCWATFDNSSGGGADMTMKLWNGTTVAASQGFTHANAGYMIALTIPPVVVVVASGTPTWKLSAACNGNTANMRAASQHNSAGNNATGITAVKIA